MDSQGELVDLLNIRRGHFVFESGHHGELWLELDPLFVRPVRLHRLIGELAVQLTACGVEMVCGPLTGGAFLAQLVATHLNVEFCYSERSSDGTPGSLYSARYRVPDGLRDVVRGKRVAVVDDVINAGSSVRATIADLQESGAQPVALAALLVLGTPADRLAAELAIPLISVARLENSLWPPDECPLCRC